jgi:uncharacterized protein YciI
MKQEGVLMFLILLSYKQPIQIVDQYLVEHRAYLEECYQKDCLVVSGPRNPRTGGVLISQLTSRTQLEALLAQDPFSLHDVANYEIIEFLPVKYHKQFASFIGEPHV